MKNDDLWMVRYGEVLDFMTSHHRKIAMTYLMQRQSLITEFLIYAVMLRVTAPPSL